MKITLLKKIFYFALISITIKTIFSITFVYSDHLLLKDQEDESFELDDNHEDEDESFELDDDHFIEHISNTGEISTSNKTNQKQLSKQILGHINDKMEQKVSSFLNNLNSNGKIIFSTDVIKNYNNAYMYLEAFIPLYNDNESTLFTEFSYRKHPSSMFSGRQFINLGLGYRLTDQQNNIGINIFYDYDLTLSHKRASVGLEYDSGFVNLTTNFYFPISQWKISSHFIQYNERPAYGYDLNTTIILPRYPQLKIHLNYENYQNKYLDALGLSKQNIHDLEKYFVQYRKNNRFSYGISYKPIPLLSFYIGQKKLQDGSYYKDLNLNLIYHFGMPLKHQLSNNQNVQHHLSGNKHRYNFVNRNNNIVLAYQKADVNQLDKKDTPPKIIEISAYNVAQLNATNDYQPLNLEIPIFEIDPRIKDNSNNYKVEWNLSNLLLETNKSSAGGLKKQVLIPPYKGSYEYSGIIINIKNNETQSFKGKVVVGLGESYELIIEDVKSYQEEDINEITSLDKKFYDNYIRYKNALTRSNKNIKSSILHLIYDDLTIEHLEKNGHEYLKFSAKDNKKLQETNLTSIDTVDIGFNFNNQEYSIPVYLKKSTGFQNHTIKWITKVANYFNYQGSLKLGQQLNLIVSIIDPFTDKEITNKQSITYQWKVNNISINEANSHQYTIDENTPAGEISVDFSYNGQTKNTCLGSYSLNEHFLQPENFHISYNAPFLNSILTETLDEFQVGTTLTAKLTDEIKTQGFNEKHLLFVWKADGEIINNQTSKSYTTTKNTLNQEITLEISHANNPNTLIILDFGISKPPLDFYFIMKYYGKSNAVPRILNENEAFYLTDKIQDQEQNMYINQLGIQPVPVKGSSNNFDIKLTDDSGYEYQPIGEYYMIQSVKLLHTQYVSATLSKKGFTSITKKIRILKPTTPKITINDKPYKEGTKIHAGQKIKVLSSEYDSIIAYHWTYPPLIFDRINAQFSEFKVPYEAIGKTITLRIEVKNKNTMQENSFYMSFKVED